MKKQKIFILFILLAFFNNAFAQLRRANKYYNNFDYANAIPLYKKIVKDDSNLIAITNLANSYRLINDYEQAEVYYSAAILLPEIPPIIHFYYGLVLKNNNKIDKARQEFLLYLKLVPGDEKAEIAVKSCNEIKKWDAQPPRYELKNMEELNTAHAEFSPVLYKNNLLFVSERLRDLVHFQKSNMNHQPFLDIYISNLKRDKDSIVYGKAKAFSRRINSEYHEGPLCFNADQNKLFFTKVPYSADVKDTAFVNRAKIYTSYLKKNRWSIPRSFVFNNDAYSVAHPSLSDDGQFLFFVSDMPGGYGGKDIYVCKKEGDKWGTPQNLGNEVNTLGNELFPYIRKDGILFFSSDGHVGFGGLDVFSASKIGNKWGNVQNAGAPLNSSTDDFGITFSDSIHGYVSSNRPGGKGSDDIYSFAVLNNLITVSGKVLLSEDVSDPARGAKILLLSEDGTVIAVTTTDSTGFFKFENLSPDQKYLVKVDEKDPEFVNKKKFYLTNENDKIIRVTVMNEKGGKFVFENLPADHHSLSLLENPDNDSLLIGGKLLMGDTAPQPMANVRMYLVNEKGEVLQTTTTNAFGAFAFKSLPPDQKFLIKIDENDTQFYLGKKIFIAGKDGQEIQLASSDAEGKFKFEFLSTDEKSISLMKIEEDDFRFNLNGKFLTDKNAPIANKKVNLLNEKGEVIQTVITDTMGKFVFKNLPADQNYLFALDEGGADTKLALRSKLLLNDEKGNVVKELKADATGKILFANIPEEKHSLQVQNVADSTLTIGGKFLLADDPSVPLAGNKVTLLNERGEQIQTTMTDDKGIFIFTELPPNQNFLIRLEETDTRFVNKEIMLCDKNGKELRKGFIDNKGDFKFEFLSTDKNILQLMRMKDTELSFDMNGQLLAENGSPLTNAKINLINEKGKIVGTTITDASGKFRFIKLPAYQNYLVQLADEGNTKLVAKGKLLLTDKKGETLRIFKVSGDKMFRFIILPIDQKHLNLMYIENTAIKPEPLKPLFPNREKRDSIISFETIYYNFGEWQLTPEAKEILNRIVKIMQVNTEIVAELGSHTDSKASMEFNMVLSEKRLKIVEDYLLSKGISKKRVSGKSYGESGLINICGEGVECSEEEHAKNRRTEIRLKRE